MARGFEESRVIIVLNKVFVDSTSPQLHSLF